MRKVVFCIAVCLVLAWHGETYGQARLGIKGGLSISEVPSSALFVPDERGLDKFRIGVDNIKYGIHLGMFVQAQFGHFFVQPEVLFNTVAVDYTIEDLQSATPLRVRDEMYRNLDIPLLLGLKFGPVRLGAGPVGHLYLDNTSDLESELQDEAKYEQDFERITWGWQAGIGLDIWKLHLDARYEGNLSQFGDHFVFYGQSYAFQEHPARFLFSAGISF